jgi:hypothetical protein
MNQCCVLTFLFEENNLKTRTIFYPQNIMCQIWIQTMEWSKKSTNSDAIIMYQTDKLGVLSRPRLSTNVSWLPRLTGLVQWTFQYYQHVNKFVESTYLENSEKSCFFLLWKCGISKFEEDFVQEGRLHGLYLLKETEIKSVYKRNLAQIKRIVKINKLINCV